MVVVFEARPYMRYIKQTSWAVAVQPGAQHAVAFLPLLPAIVKHYCRPSHLQPSGRRRIGNVQGSIYFNQIDRSRMLPWWSQDPIAVWLEAKIGLAQHHACRVLFTLLPELFLINGVSTLQV
jgi:hypothetical protein